MSHGLPRRLQALSGTSALKGFSLIEMMVGLTIGLLCTLVIATVLSMAEGQRRGTSLGTDAQVSGSLALYQVQRELAMAGYGFASESNAVGCTLQVNFNGAVSTALPPQLAPVFITQGAAGASDQVRVLSSSKYIDPTLPVPSLIGYTVPSRVIAPHYDPASATLALRSTYNVWSSLSIQAGDLMVAVVNAGVPCGLFQVNAVTTGAVTRNTGLPWNAAGHPANATQDPDALLNPQGSFLVNLGSVIDVVYSIDNQQRLVESRLDTTTMTRQVSVLQSNVVMLKALYGRNTDATAGVDTYDYTTPATPAAWAQLFSVRLIAVTRSAQYEREEVTTTSPLLDVGVAATVAGAQACGNSKCITLDLSGLPDWKHYRYKVFDTVVPLRNQLWKS